LFSLGSLLKIKEEAQIFGLHTCFRGKSYALSFYKNGFGYILCNIFKNSGHPASNVLATKV
jgi:hypothetical protein